MEKEKDFDAVAWVRSVRDEHYRKYGHLPMREYAKKLSELGEQTELAKKLDRPRSSRNRAPKPLPRPIAQKKAQRL